MVLARTALVQTPASGPINVSTAQDIAAAAILDAFSKSLAITSSSSLSRTHSSPDEVSYIRVVVPFTSEGAATQGQRLGSNRHNPYFLPLALNRLKQGLLSFDCQNAGNPSFDPAPPCLEQPHLLFRGQATAYPHIRKDR